MIQPDTREQSKLTFDAATVSKKFGPNAKVHLDLGSVGPPDAEGKSPKSVDDFLKDRGRLSSDFRGKLQLASADDVGLTWNYPGTTYTNPAKSLFVLVES